MRLHLLLSVTLCALGAGSSGWKPIPPPRGHYLSKASHDHFKHYSDEYRAASNPDKTDALSTSEIFFNSPTHSYKTFSSDATHLDLFKKEHPKIYKPVLSSLDEGKRQSAQSYHNFNYRRKPIKSGFYDKPDVIFSEDLSHSKNPFQENEIRPLGYLGSHGSGQCSLYKVAFRQDLYFQYVQYKVVVPDLKEFTLCMWNKFSNHTNDHPLFSYAVRNNPKALAVWVSTTDRSNYFNMAINGHNIYRLNYPIRLNRWYHTCASWNGKSGEWQVWVNAERIGRGFHNLLVGHVIKGGGIAITGQEQRQLGGGFLEGPEAPKGSGGFLGEVTMVQFYKIALTAGKAYNDHRHHHSVHASTTPTPPPPPSSEETPTTNHPFLENGQLKRKIPVFELAESLRPKLMPDSNQPQLDTSALQISGLDSGLNLFNGPFQGAFLPGLDASVLTPYMVHFPDHNLFKRNNGKQEDTRSKRNGDSSQGNAGENLDLKVKFVQGPQQVHVDKVKFPEEVRSKREVEEEQESSREKREYVLVDEDKIEPDDENDREGRRLRRPIRQNSFGNHGQRRVGPKRPLAMRKQESEISQEIEESDPSKRQVYLGDFGFSQFLPQFEALTYRLPKPVANPKPPKAEEAADDDDDGPIDPIEPAEGEVRRIMSVCTGCEPDPFRKVSIISWRSVPKKIYSGALFLKARPECRRF